MSSQTGQVVYTNKAHCRDCYRCLRFCPVKAIKMENGQAYVVAERCISCGTCIRECPQGAKAFRNDIEQAARLIASGGPVGASVAPSFAAAFGEWERKCIPSALRRLGFAYVGETAIGAFPVARRTRELVEAAPDRSHIATACPAVVSYVEHYHPEHLDLLVPVVSPMLMHARHIKERLGREAKVVFIGPCVAKKAEADRPENAGLVDCALTFVEMLEWLEREGVHLAQCEESRFDEEPEGDSRFFPLVGGSLRTAAMATDVLAPATVSVSGVEEVSEVLAGIGPGTPPLVIEPLFCRGGCINGPVMPGKGNVYERRHDVLQYALGAPGRPAAPMDNLQFANCNLQSEGEDCKLQIANCKLQIGEGAQAAGKGPSEGALSTSLNLPRTRFVPKRVADAEGISEEQIRAVLEQTGKASPENQLNCGACGYASCRDKAIAVVRGMAEPGMCIPYMKRLAERRTDRIIETSPNGIVILDEHLQILGMNPAFRSFFMCSEAVLGRPISYLMDPDPFEQLASGRSELVETVVKHVRANLVCHQIHYSLREEKQYIGIFVNITKTQADKEKLDRLRTETAQQARELLQHQVEMAQTIARYLGESTAQSESLLDRLILLAGGESGDGEANGKYGMEWVKSIYTSK